MSTRRRKKNQTSSSTTSPQQSPPSFSTPPPVVENQSIVSHDEIIKIVKNEISETKVYIKSEFVNQTNTLKNEITSLRNENKVLRDELDRIKGICTFLETRLNETEQYGRRNNIEIAGISENVEDQELEECVMSIASYLDCEVEPNDIEACHRLPKGKNSITPKRVIVRFTNRKFAEKMKLNARNLKNVDRSTFRFAPGKLFINENLTKENRNIWYKCRKLHKSGKINRYQTSEGVVKIKLTERSPWLKMKHLNDVFGLFPDFSFHEQN